MKRTIEINDQQAELFSRIEEGLTEILHEYADDVGTFRAHEPDRDEAPDLRDLDYAGRVHELIDGTVPIYSSDIADLFYLYGDEIEHAFDDAGIGNKVDNDWPMGWKPAAIYTWLEQYGAEWFDANSSRIWDDLHDA